MEKGKKYCEGAFPTFAVIVLAVGVLWLLADLGIITANIPWLPIILIIVAVGMIAKRYKYMKK